MAGKTAGRRPKLTRDFEKRLLGLLEAGIPKSIACPGAGVDRRTMTTYQQRALAGETRYVEFMQRVETAIAKGRATLLLRINRHGGKDWRALESILKHGHASVYTSQTNINVSVEGELERILDIAQDVLGPESAAKLFAAIVGADSGAEASTAEAGPPLY